MPTFSRLSVINGVLREFAQVPVATEFENDNSKIISEALKLYLSLFQKTTLDWSFLQTDITLDTPLSDSLSNQFNSTFVLPDDYLRITKCYNSWDLVVREPYIMTQGETASFRYIKFLNDYAAFPSHFIDYFIYFVSYRLAAPLTRDDDIVKNIEIKIRDAKANAESYEMRIKTGTRTLLNPNSELGSWKILG